MDHICGRVYSGGGRVNNVDHGGGRVNNVIHVGGKFIMAADELTM